MRRNIPKELRELREAREREKDTIYYLVFIPKDGKPTGSATTLNNIWRVRIPGRRKDDPEVIEEAIRTFEKDHGVESWKEVAIHYEVDGLYNP